MAVLVYRFRYRAPGVDIGQIETEVGTVLSISDDSGGALLDIECDDSFAIDLRESMEDRGFDFVKGSPPEPTSEEFVTDLDGDKLNIEYIPSGYVPDDDIPEASDSKDLAAHLNGISNRAVPLPTQVGQVLFSTNGLTFTAELPITSDHGWLVNNDGILIVNG
jgi:hypothetical protein